MGDKAYPEVVPTWAEPPRVVAHRGASARHPENTLAAFRAALAHTSALELDVRLSSDGVPVVHHDAALGRTVRGEGRVAERTSAELAALDAGAGEGVPTLAQVLAAAPDALVDLDAKVDDGSATPLLVAVGRACLAAGARDRVLLTSFDPDAAKEWKVRFPEMRAGLIAPYELTPKEVEEVAPWCDALALAADVVTDEALAAAKRQGLLVLAWTVNDVAQAQALWARGVDGVITDDPALLAPTRA